jgi:hypothetical protein
VSGGEVAPFRSLRAGLAVGIPIAGQYCSTRCRLRRSAFASRVSIRGLSPVFFRADQRTTTCPVPCAFSSACPLVPFGVYEAIVCGTFDVLSEREKRQVRHFAIMNPVASFSSSISGYHPALQERSYLSEGERRVRASIFPHVPDCGEVRRPMREICHCAELYHALRRSFFRCAYPHVNGRRNRRTIPAAGWRDGMRFFIWATTIKDSTVPHTHSPVRNKYARHSGGVSNGRRSQKARS